MEKQEKNNLLVGLVTAAIGLAGTALFSSENVKPRYLWEETRVYLENREKFDKKVGGLRYKVNNAVMNLPFINLASALDRVEDPLLTRNLSGKDSGLIEVKGRVYSVSEQDCGLYSLRKPGNGLDVLDILDTEGEGAKYLGTGKINLNYITLEGGTYLVDKDTKEVRGIRDPKYITLVLPGIKSLDSDRGLRGFPYFSRKRDKVTVKYKPLEKPEIGLQEFVEKYIPGRYPLQSEVIRADGVIK